MQTGYDPRVRRGAALLLLSAGCVSSVEFELPDAPEVQTWVLYASGQPAQTYAPDEPVLLGLGDEPLYALGLPRTPEEYLFDRVGPAFGPRPLDAIASRRLVAQLDGTEVDWRDTADDLGLSVSALDPELCLSKPGACVRNDDVFPWCDLRCTPPQIDAPLAPVMPEVAVPTYEPEDCASGSAPFGDGRCTPIAECGPGDPPDLPNGELYRVPPGEAIGDAIAAQPNAEVFLLPTITTPVDVTVNRPVVLWARCPTETMLANVSLVGGSAVGRLTVTSSLTIDGPGIVRRSDVERLTINGRAEVDDSRIGAMDARDGGAIRGVVLTNSSEFSNDSFVMQRVRVTGFELTFRDADVSLNDIANTGRYARMNFLDSTVTATSVAMAGSIVPAIGVDRSSMSMTDARFDDVMQAISAQVGTVRLSNFIIEGEAGIDLGGAEAEIRRGRFDTRDSGLLVGSNPNGEGRLTGTDLAIRGVRCLWLRGRSTTLVERVSLDDCEAALTTRQSRIVNATDLIIRNAATALSIFEPNGPTTLRRVDVAGRTEGDATSLGVLGADTIGAPGVVQIEALQATRTTALLAGDGSALLMLGFAIEDGAGAALDLRTKSVTLESGRIGGYEIGVLHHREADVLDLLDGIIVDADEPLGQAPP